MKRYWHWLKILAGVTVEFHFRIRRSSNTLKERWRMMKRYQVRCSKCGRKIDWGYDKGSCYEDGRFSCENCEGER